MKRPPAEPEPTGLERELVERGVTRSVAADLVRDFPKDRIKTQIEHTDWLRETKPKRVADVGAIWPRRSARTSRRRPASGAGPSVPGRRRPHGAAEREAEARQATARTRGRARIAGFWKGLTPDEQQRLDAAALAGAAAGDRAAYEVATGPVRRLLLAGLRDALVRRRLGLPAAD